MHSCSVRKARGIFRLQTSDFGLHTSKFRLQISESLFPDFLRHSFSKKYLHIITHCIKNILCILYICMKVETSHYSYIMTASLIRRDLIIMKMSVEIFIYFFYRQHHVFDITMTDNFQYQSQCPGDSTS
jgi:hypothetical protein